MSTRIGFMFGFPAVLTFAAAAGLAASPIDSMSLAADVAVETVLTGLGDSCSVAIKPSAPNSAIYEILVYDRRAGRIVSVRSDQPSQLTEVISGLSHAERSGVFFVLGNSHVVVGGEQGKAFLRMYELPVVGPVTSAGSPKQTLEASEQTEATAARHVAAIARTRANDRVQDMLIVATRSDDGVGRLWKVPVRADTLGELAVFGSESKIDSVAALSVSEQGFLVATEAGGPGSRDSSELVFYNPINGESLLQVPLEVQGIVGMAYSPSSGNLYVGGTATGSEQPGVFRIDDKSTAGKPACTAVKVANVEQPRSLAFGPDGVLYVASAGGADSGAEEGSLQRISGDL